MSVVDPGATTVEDEAITGVYASVARGRVSDLAQCVQRFHFGAGSIRGRGRARVRHGRNRAASLIAPMLRLPRATDVVPLDILVIRSRRSEEWVRSFGGVPLRSTQYARDGYLIERFRLFELCLHVDIRGRTLVMTSRAGALVLRTRRISLPAWFTPRVDARVSGSSDGTMQVCVSVRAPLVGLVFGYYGIIEEVA